MTEPLYLSFNVYKQRNCSIEGDVQLMAITAIMLNREAPDAGRQRNINDKANRPKNVIVGPDRTESTGQSQR